MHKFHPGTRVLKEIRKFQKTTELLIPKIAFLRVVQELLQKESSWYRIQVGTVLALHEATKAYLIRLFKDTNVCTIHARHVTIMQKDVKLARQMRRNFQLKLIRIHMFFFSKLDRLLFSIISIWY